MTSVGMDGSTSADETAAEVAAALVAFLAPNAIAALGVNANTPMSDMAAMAAGLNLDLTGKRTLRP